MTDVRTTSVAPPETTGATGTPPRPAAARGPARPSSAPVYLTAVTLFAGFSALFAARMTAGDDPALGLKPGALATPAPPGVLQKVILTRRIRVDGLTRAQIRRRGVDRIVVVTRRAPAAATTTAVASGPGDTSAPTPAIAGAAPAASTRSGGSTTAGGRPNVVADQPSGTQAPVAAAPAPASAAPTPEPAATPAPVPAPVVAPAPVATTTS